MSKSVIIRTDPISDMLTRVRNAIAVNKEQISLPHSKSKETVAKILADCGYFAEVSTNNDNNRKYLNITITSVGESPKITELKRLSRPGRRLYVKSDEIPTVRRGRGIVIVSTSKGVMTGHEAKVKKVGGELICEVY